MKLERFLLFIFILGIGGTLAELLMSGHTESGLQWIPLALLATAAIGLAVQGIAGRVGPLHAILWCFLASGVVGVGLHTRAKMEFQAESDRTLHGWALFLKSFETKSPPALAPGAMVQLGLIGFAYQHARRARQAKNQKENS
jgi:hypothetical protein